MKLASKAPHLRWDGSNSQTVAGCRHSPPKKNRCHPKPSDTCISSQFPTCPCAALLLHVSPGQRTAKQRKNGDQLNDDGSIARCLFFHYQLMWSNNRCVLSNLLLTLLNSNFVWPILHEGSFLLTTLPLWRFCCCHFGTLALNIQTSDENLPTGWPVPIGWPSNPCVLGARPARMQPEKRGGQYHLPSGQLT